MKDPVAQLVARFQQIERERMAGLPLCNPALAVEAVGFRGFEDCQLGVLVTPWCMNLVLLSDDDAWREWVQGSKSEWAFPAGRHEFTTCRDEVLPTYLSAVLFRTVQDFPDAATAQAVAAEVMERLFAEPEPPRSALDDAKPVSRRALLSGLGSDHGRG
jgi:[NiFe] hydrogenase assembly HybE family chaperone